MTATVDFAARERGMTPRRILSAALLAALLIPAASADAAKPPSCTRGGATLEQASGNVRVVRRELMTQSAQETRREGLIACWAPTGKRFRIATKRDFGDDLRSSTRVEIVDERYVGVVLTGEGGVSIGVRASVYDARKAKRLHSSSPRCDADDDDFRGPDDVVFPPKGGMAFACGPLWLFRSGTQKTRRRSSRRRPAPARWPSPTAPTASSTGCPGRWPTAASSHST